MRTTLLLCAFLFCASFIKDGEQNRFYKITEGSADYEKWVERDNYSSHFSDLFNYPHNRELIGIEALDSAASYDFSRLVNLESLTVMVGILPEEPDSVRIKYANEVTVAMSKMSCFSKCPKLKRIIFIIGSHFFTTEAECEPKWNETFYGKSYNKRLEQLDLRAAWKLFGNSVQEQLPGIKLYGITEVW